MDLIPEKHADAQAEANRPASEVDPDVLNAWVDAQKVQLGVVETDIRDAKRRVTLKKGPKKRAPQPAEGSASASNEDGSCDDEDDLEWFVCLVMCLVP